MGAGRAAAGDGARPAGRAPAAPGRHPPAGARGRGLARGPPRAAWGVEHGLAPLRAPARPRRLRGGARRPGRRRRGRGARAEMVDATVVRAHRRAAGAKRVWDGQALAGPLARRLLDQAAPALRRIPGPPLAVVLAPGRTRESRAAADAPVGGMAQGTRCLIGGRGLRRRPDPAGPAGASGPAGDPVRPGPERAAAAARSRAAPAGGGTGSGGS
jgi:hypothetical protein